MANNYLEGTTWRWRQGCLRLPIHSLADSKNIQKTSELYLPVADTTQADAILGQLSQNGIMANSKKTHSTIDVIPAGTLIVYASITQEEPALSEKENIKKLKNYILSNGGKIFQRQSSPYKKLLRYFFNRGGK